MMRIEVDHRIREGGKEKETVGKLWKEDIISREERCCMRLMI